MTTTKVKKKTLPKGLDWLPSGSIRVRVLNENRDQVSVGSYADEKTAVAALAAAQTDIARGDWVEPGKGKILFRDLAAQ